MPTYHTSSPSDDDADVYPYTKMDDADPDEDPNAALTSQTLNADGTPKRPMNAFMIFARRRRPQVSAENQSMRTGDISKILSQEWKAMQPSEKQFYQTQAKQLKESFNTKYPDYVYRRRPNNTRKRRKPDADAPLAGRDRDTDDAESSPDAEDAPPLPDHTSHAGYYGRSMHGAGASSYSYGSPYNGGGYGSSSHAHAHARTASYPYPPTDTYRTSPYDPVSAPRLLSSPYYPPYDTSTSASSSHSHSHSHPHSQGHTHVHSAGLRKAQSIPSMPLALSSSADWSAPAPVSMPAGAAAASSYPAAAYGAVPYGPVSTSAASASAYSTSPGPRYASAPDSPQARYSPFASTNASASGSSNGSPAPAYLSSYGTVSPGPTYANAYSAPRALVNGVGGGGGGGLSGGGTGDVGNDYYWRANKLL
ncbi:hypothetical protein GGX14DRAFT_699279 [Mycena pura]|uniref:HMG box domain-containing protein n=1 Tax=Mycena pura TaxID=153505 RepID=A0AAD6V826_9AGAR|nr:hypothetical protein GGX14DRAFT_699279 [Mycena pura]